MFEYELNQDREKKMFPFYSCTYKFTRLNKMFSFTCNSFFNIIQNELVKGFYLCVVISKTIIQFNEEKKANLDHVFPLFLVQLIAISCNTR